MRIQPRPTCGTIITSRGHSRAELARLLDVSPQTVVHLVKSPTVNPERTISQLIARKVARSWARVTNQQPDIVFDQLFVIERRS